MYKKVINCYGSEWCRWRPVGASAVCKCVNVCVVCGCVEMCLSVEFSWVYVSFRFSFSVFVFLILFNENLS